MKSLYPLAKSNMRAVHHGSDCHSELFTAFVALNHAVAGFLRLALKPRYIVAIAMRADRAFRPANLLKDSPRFIFCQSPYVYCCHVCQAREFRWNVLHF